MLPKLLHLEVVVVKINDDAKIVNIYVRRL